MALLPVLDAAASLTAPGEADMITAAASVAVSSREYWEVQLVPTTYNPLIVDGGTTYGPCIKQYPYADVSTVLAQCAGLSTPTVFTPTGLHGDRSSPPCCSSRVKPAGTRT